MAVYRFKISMEENEDIFRDIDIQASQSFEDFHTIIQAAFKFDAKLSASFFISDDYWRKGQEITLRKEDLPLEEDEIRQKVKPKKLMADIQQGALELESGTVDLEDIDQAYETGEDSNLVDKEENLQNG